MRLPPVTAIVFASFAASAVQAQAPVGTAPSGALHTPPVREETVLDRHTQRVEHITHEDAGSRVDEVRAGGQTQRITVQPKAPVPAYEVLPANPAQREAAPGGTGPRVWKISF